MFSCVSPPLSRVVSLFEVMIVMSVLEQVSTPMCSLPPVFIVSCLTAFASTFFPSTVFLPVVSIEAEAAAVFKLAPSLCRHFIQRQGSQGEA